MDTQKYFAPVDRVYDQGYNLDIRARIAHSLTVAVLTSNAVVSLHHDDEKAPSPKSIARECCDIAEQLVDAFSERDWIKPGLTPKEQIEEVARQAYYGKTYNDKMFAGMIPQGGSL